MSGSSKKNFPLVESLGNNLLQEERSGWTVFGSKETLENLLTSLPKGKNPFLFLFFEENFFSHFPKENIKEKKSLNEFYQKKEKNRLVFVNGYFEPSLSSIPEGVTIVDLKNPPKQFFSFLKNLAAKELAKEKDPFVHLNGLYYTDGILVYLPANHVLNEPLHIYHHLTSGVKEKSILMPRIALVLSRGAKATCVYSVQSPKKEILYVPQTSIHLEEGATLTLEYLLESRAQYHLDFFRLFQKKGSDFHFTSFVAFCEKSLLNFHTFLQEQESHAHFEGATLLSHQAHHHCEMKLFHESLKTHSRQLFRSVIKDQGHLSFTGHVLIMPNADLAEASQLTQNILLSDEGRVVLEPYLEIFADDVKATHGATLTHFDEEELFYLRTRGLSEEMSKKLLIDGFVNEILLKIKTPSIQKLVKEALIPYL